MVIPVFIYIIIMDKMEIIIIIAIIIIIIIITTTTRVVIVEIEVEEILRNITVRNRGKYKWGLLETLNLAFSWRTGMVDNGVVQ